jgi:hypothetical protein
MCLYLIKIKDTKMGMIVIAEIVLEKDKKKDLILINNIMRTIKKVQVFIIEIITKIIKRK